MDRRSWLWRRKSTEKSPGESESSGSVSSHSERYSDDQEVLRSTSNNASPQKGQSPDVSSNIRDVEAQEAETVKNPNDKLALAATSSNASPQHGQSPEASSSIGDDLSQETVKNLSEKLSAALLNISAKEDLVKQHAKVAEEAVAGWEQAEVEVTALKRQLEAASQKNASLEDQVSHLDDALKECVRQLRQSREEQEEKIHDAVAKKSHDWESSKAELQDEIAELRRQLESAKAAAAAVSVEHDLQGKLQAIEKENMDLKVQLLAQSKDQKILALERDLSSQAAETASKQHLESVKKIAKVEAECRRLRHLARRTSLSSDSRLVPNSACGESLTDSQSDSGDRMLAVDNEMRNSDSWASALIAELDQFKNGKAGVRNLGNNPMEIDLMDDFLEMERLAALPEADHVSSSFETETDSDQAATRDISSKFEMEALRHQIADFQAKVEKIENEKAELGMALGDSRNQLEVSCNALTAAQNRLFELQLQLDLANESKCAVLRDMEQLDAARKELESQLESKSIEVRELHAAVASLETNADVKELESRLESASMEVTELRETVTSLQERIDEQMALSAQHKAEVEAAEAAKESLEAQLQSANSEVGKLRGVVNALECEAEKEKAALSAELAAQLEAVESIRKALESKVESSCRETGKLREKVESLEAKLKEESALTQGFSAKAEAAESERQAVECRLEAANLDVMKLSNKVSLLQGKIEQEKLLSEDYEAKCRKLEAQLSRDSREAKLWRLANSNGDLKVKQEKELASAAGKLAECQKTIASLGRQLKSLTDIDDVLSEPAKLETRDMLLELGNGDAELHSADFADGLCDFDIPDGNGSCFLPFPSLQPSSPPSEISVFSGGLSSLSSYRGNTRM